jgi:hypothetical protein
MKNRKAIRITLKIFGIAINKAYIDTYKEMNEIN